MCVTVCSKRVCGDDALIQGEAFAKSRKDEMLEEKNSALQGGHFCKDKVWLKDETLGVKE